MIRLGCIHGRFQPFHNGHYEYMLGALARCERLFIGITQFEPLINDVGSPAHRISVFDNPFSYWERVEIIRSVVRASKIDGDRIEVVPFPIHTPSSIKNFVPAKSVMFTTIYEQWNHEKIGRLKAQGFDVEVLWERKHKAYEGKLVRNALRQNDETLRSMLPPGAIEVIEIIAQTRSL